MQTATIDAVAPLPDIERRAGYLGGAGMAMADARWIRTHPITRIEPGATTDGGYRLVRLFSGDDHLDVHGGNLDLGWGKTFCGEDTMVTLCAYVQSDIDNILRWEQRNPGERRYDERQCAISGLQEAVSNQMLMGPQGAELIEALDRTLAYGPQTREIVAMRGDLRLDREDAAETSRKVLTKVLALQSE